jgi:hypothetical protein
MISADPTDIFDVFDLTQADIEMSTDLRVQAAYDEMASARHQLHAAIANTTVRQEAFDDAKRDMILGGHVIGKNAEEREAKLAELLTVQTAHLRDARRYELGARLAYDLAQDNVSRVKLLAQLLGA